MIVTTVGKVMPYKQSTSSIQGRLHGGMRRKRRRGEMEERRDVMTTHSHVESRSALPNGSPDRVSDSHSPSSQLGLTGVTGPEPEIRARWTLSGSCLPHWTTAGLHCLQRRDSASSLALQSCTVLRATCSHLRSSSCLSCVIHALSLISRQSEMPLGRIFQHTHSNESALSTHCFGVT